MQDVAAGNRDMAAAWDGDEGAHWSAHASRYERGAAPYRERLLESAALVPGERVLEVGCGAGRTTRDAARMVAPNGRVLGLDLSAAMLILPLAVAFVSTAGTSSEPVSLTEMSSAFATPNAAASTATATVRLRNEAI